MLSESIHQVRARIEERLSAFEKSFLQGFVSQDSLRESLKDFSHSSSTVSEVGNAAEPNQNDSDKNSFPSSDQEVHQLKKVVEDQRIQIQNFEEMVQKLTESLKMEETKCQELLNRLHIIHH